MKALTQYVTGIILFAIMVAASAAGDRRSERQESVPATMASSVVAMIYVAVATQGSAASSAATNVVLFPTKAACEDGVLRLRATSMPYGASISATCVEGVLEPRR